MADPGRFPGADAPTLALATAVLYACGCAGGDAASPTFTRDIAPIVFEHCAKCHHAGGPAPFGLLDYDSVRRHAREIVEVTRERFMPPWLPEEGDYALAGRRGLSESQIATLARWARSGTPEGDAAHAPHVPRPPRGWLLGEPDLIVRLDAPYTVPAEGFDVFRNFVLPVPVDRSRWVRAVELQPGNPKVVHHAILHIDPTGSSRRLAAEDPEAGFGGMEMGASRPPDGHFVGWTPGKVPFAGRDGMAWSLDRGTDLVLQLHMLPSGKPEQVQPSVGLHFTDMPPTRHPSTILLYREDIDIAAGESGYRIRDSLELPVPVELLGIYPHAHYLGKDLGAFVRLPDGTEKTLLRIPDWDFNWQDEYRYVAPVPLPAGSEVSMRYVYDNSEDNPRNPSIPPRRVTSGNRSIDEMGTLTLQVLPRNEADRARLSEAVALQMLAKDPEDWTAHWAMGSALLEQRRWEQAREHLARAATLRSDVGLIRFGLGLADEKLGRIDLAVKHYRQAVSLDPDMSRAWNNLGHLSVVAGRFDEAVEHLERALESRPDLAQAHYNLAVALTSLERYTDAIAHYRLALEIEPAALTFSNLGAVHQLRGELDEAVRSYRQALEVDPQLAQAHNNLGRALQSQGRLEQAIRSYRTALRIDPDFELARRNLDTALAQQRDR